MLLTMATDQLGPDMIEDTHRRRYVLQLRMEVFADTGALLAAIRAETLCNRHTMIDALSRQVGGQSPPAMTGFLRSGLLVDRLGHGAFHRDLRRLSRQSSGSLEIRE